MEKKIDDEVRVGGVVVRGEGKGKALIPNILGDEKRGCTVSHAEHYGHGRNTGVSRFMAVLELIKESLVELVQNEPFAPIHVRARAEEGIA